MRESQINWNSLQNHLYKGSPYFQWWLQQRGWSLSEPIAIQHLASSLGTQATMLAFIDCFYLVSIWLLFLLPFVWMLDSPRST